MEALDKKDPGHAQWAYDVLNTWQIQLAEYPEPAALGGSPETAMLLDGGEFGRISLKDRRLLQDALILGVTRS